MLDIYNELDESDWIDHINLLKAKSILTFLLKMNFEKSWFEDGEG